MDKIINAFPGYEYVARGEDNKPHNMFRGVDLGFGGYVYAEPGMYKKVALLDINSLHPSSIILLNKLGKYTDRYEMLREARVYIKHKDYKSAGKLFDGKLEKYLTSDEEADELSVALKRCLNQFFGISYSKYDYPTVDKRDKNNIIALRGALFMKTLQDEVVKKGFTVAHIKTDSIKIPDATQEIIDFCMEFGKKYGYEFDHECTYERMCLVNNAVYIAKYDDKGIRNKGGKHAGDWTATGAEFQHPYIFKSLFSKEEIDFKDLCEKKNVSKGLIYLDHNESLPDVSENEKIFKKVLKDDPNNVSLINELKEDIAKGHDYKFVGKIGLFTPIEEGYGGGLLMAKRNDDVDKYDSVNGTKGYRWYESEFVKSNKLENHVDMSYFENLAEDAIKSIEKYGDFDIFANGSDYEFESYIDMRNSEYEKIPIEETN